MKSPEVTLCNKWRNQLSVCEDCEGPAVWRRCHSAVQILRRPWETSIVHCLQCSAVTQTETWNHGDWRWSFCAYWPFRLTKQKTGRFSFPLSFVSFLFRFHCSLPYCVCDSVLNYVFILWALTECSGSRKHWVTTSHLPPSPCETERPCQSSPFSSRWQVSVQLCCVEGYPYILPSRFGPMFHETLFYEFGFVVSYGGWRLGCCQPCKVDLHIKRGTSLENCSKKTLRVVLRTMLVTTASICDHWSKHWPLLLLAWRPPHYKKSCTGLWMCCRRPRILSRELLSKCNAGERREEDCFLPEIKLPIITAVDEENTANGRRLWQGQVYSLRGRGAVETAVDYWCRPSRRTCGEVSLIVVLTPVSCLVAQFHVWLLKDHFVWT